MKSFTAKRLRVTLIMADGNSVFPGTNSNTLIIENLRMSVQLQSVARLATHADIRIFGMLQADMNALTVAWALPPIVLNNLVIVEADKGAGFVQVFRGTITEAQPNYQAAPNVHFQVIAQTGYFQQINAAPPSSYPAATNIGVVAADLAQQMGFTFTNGGADGTLNAGAYFWGSLWDQLADACAATNTDFYVQNENILITKSGLPGSEQPAVVLNPVTGLIGYPMFERAGLVVNALFDPIFLCGVPLDIQGDVPAANGRWYPYALNHYIEANVPHGQWITQMNCTKVLQ